MDLLPENFNAGAREMQNLAATAAKSMTLESSPRASIVAADVDSNMQLRATAPTTTHCHFDQREKSAFRCVKQKQISLFVRNDNFFGAIDELDGGLHSL